MAAIVRERHWCVIPDSGPEYSVCGTVCESVTVSWRSAQSVVSDGVQKALSPLTVADLRKRSKFDASVPVLVIATVPTWVGPYAGTIPVTSKMAWAL